jgi:hypothetical protein
MNRRGIYIRTQRTSCGRARAEVGVRDLANVNVKDGLFKPAREDVSSETDNVLCPDEGAYCIIYLCSQKVGVFARARHGELIEPGEIDTAAISEPIRRECWNCGIGDGGNDDAGLTKKKKKHYVRSVSRLRRELTSAPIFGPINSWRSTSLEVGRTFSK